jgi:UDP-glucose 4-epimerase
VDALFPDCRQLYLRRGWRMLPGIDRVYVNRRALKELSWRPRYDFGHILGCLRRGEDVFSPLARTVGSKGYHAQSFGQQPYPVESGA